MAWIDFRECVLGRSRIRAGRLGISASYGMGEKEVARAIEAGMNYAYWGSMRRERFARGLRQVKREQVVLVLQSYARWRWALRGSVERGLRELGFERAEVLLLGWWNRAVAEPILEEACELQRRGLIATIAASTHERTQVVRNAANPVFGIEHFRYNAKHPGAEQDIFPHLGEENRPGLVAYTATSWGQLMKYQGKERTPTAGDCYRWVLTNPNVDVCMTGIKDSAQLDHALKAFEQGPMAEEEMAWMRRVGAGYS